VTLQRLAIDFRTEELVVRSLSTAAKPIALQGRGRRSGPEGGSGAHPRRPRAAPEALGRRVDVVLLSARPGSPRGSMFFWPLPHQMKQSQWAYNAARGARGREEKRLAWCEYHREQAERHWVVERHQEDRCYHEPQRRGG